MRRLFFIHIPIAAAGTGLFLGIIYAVTIYVIMPYYTGAFSSLVTVPEVLNMTLEEADSILKSCKLNAKILDSSYYHDIDSGCIINQLPHGNTLVKRKRTVYLTKSLGKKMIKIPDLSGQSVRQAIHNIRSLGLNLFKLKYVFSEKPGNMVVGSEPPPDKMVRSGEEINLLVSLANQPQVIEMPNLVGLEYLKAKSMLLEYGLNLGNTSFINRQDIVPRTVVSQNPDKGLMVKIGREIDLTVSE
ncbi:MAG: PASTA domain-containing protein [bacterium]